MSKHVNRNKLARNGFFTARGLYAEAGEGYVIRVADLEHQPPQVHTVVRQPGQDNTTIETVNVEVREQPGSDLEQRLRGWELAEPASTERMAAFLEDHASNPLAQLALSHLSML